MADPTHLVQYDAGSNRNYVNFEGRTYYGPFRPAPGVGITKDERVTVEPLGVGVLVRSATHRETWCPESISHVEAGNNGAADWSGA
jgi:hypothetical protein